MGVDVSTYRSRVGTFNPGHGAAGLIIINFSILMRIIGSVSFVKMLLIMSGIEQNPGPDTFIFRYQYLLVNVGTKVLWELFDVMAGNDISKYLTSKSKDIQQLTAARLITPAKKQKLLSANYKPCIADFDITLLSCLLRNICGLCPPRDQVWMKPAPTDTCIEADIARLRMCRNELMHSDKLRLPDAELKVKWNELSMILTRLNLKAGITQLQKMIDDAEDMDVDENLRNDYNEVIKAWEESDKIVDRGIEELKSKVTAVKHEVSDVKHEVSAVKHDVLDVKHDVSDVKDEVSDVKCEVSDVKHEVSDVKREVSAVKHDVLDVKHEVSDVKHEVSAVKHDVLDVKHDVSDVKDEVSDVKCEVSDVKHEVSDVKREVSAVKHDVLDVKHEVSDVKHEVSNVKHEVSDVKCEVSDVKCEVSAVKCEVSDVKREVLDVKHDVLDVKHEVSDVKHDVSDVNHEVSDVKHDVLDVKHEVSDVKHDVLDVKHDVSDVKHDVSDVKHEVSDVKHDVSDVKHEVSHVMKKLDDVALSQQKAESQHVELTDIQRDIIEMYKCHFKALPVSPVFENKKEDLLHMYQSPTMSRVETTRSPARSNVDQTRTGNKPINGYSDIFCEENQSFKQIFITGDAGVGKTSFCKHLCLLWCIAKCGDRLDSECEELQKDVDFISKFEYVFYINLRDTYHTHVLDMITEQFYESEEKYKQLIRSILRHKQCLVLMDGMDEWSPKKIGKKNHKIPEKIYSESCVYLTTCRPYRIESVRLSHQTDIDHQIQMTGISGASSERYIKNIINCINKRTSSDKKVSVFKREINKCGLKSQLCIPLIASHLVLLWFEITLTNMPRAVIYANILEMLFVRAKERGVAFPPSLASQNKAKKRGALSRYLIDKMSNFKSIFTHTMSLQLPDSLSELIYLNEYVNLLYKVCHLSFCSMFKQEDNVASLIFTRKQLESEPYCFSCEETDFLCKIGVLSKNEVFWSYSVEKLKLSFIHKTYLEYFAALFISSFDPSKSFNDVTIRWKCLDQVLPGDNLLLLLAGFSYDGIKQLFDNIYLQLSDDLTLIRRNAIYHYDQDSYKTQLKSLQNIVVNCFNEFSRSKAIVLKMEDFIFDYDSNIDILRQLLLLNKKCVKSVHSVKGKYYPEFDQIHCLQYLNVKRVLSPGIVKFTQFMLQNKSTLHTVCIKGDYKDEPLIPELPVRSLHHLTSLSLSYVKLQHNSLHDLVKFLSDNVLIENIKLFLVSCVNHKRHDSYCTLTLNLPQHTKLTSLYLHRVNILCNNVNKSSLKSVTLCPLSERIVRLRYNDLFKCFKDSQLEHLYINGYYGYMSDNKTMKTLTSTVKSLPCIKYLRLDGMELPDDVLLQLHPQVTQVKIKLVVVTMSRQCFHSFVESFVNISEIKVELSVCKIRSVDGETHSVLSYKESVKYMSEYLESISTINITDKGDRWLDFETRSCQ